MCSPDVMKLVHGQEGHQCGGHVAADAEAGASATAQGTPSPRRAPAPLIRGSRVSDLTHTFGNDFPVLEPIVLKPNIDHFAHIADEGFNANKLEIDEHTGTHVDGPAHLVDGPIYTDEIPIDRLIAPLCVIRIGERVAKDHDATLTADDILAYESRYGRIPDGALVVMDSGWCERINTPGAYINRDADGVPHFPGLGFDAAELLVRERSIVAAGTDTPSLDASKNLQIEDPGAHRIVLGDMRYGVENIANLDTVPDFGATVLVGLIKHRKGFAGPCRVFGIY
ncbi:cyclase [Streptomyces cirratus]|uniref:Cyclase n=1 Tax=Streptomyces cirratus TaxID=68187 RepID=A0ABQ3F3A8_9ACTN|nr:cyclase family protein [Streptomyces cirratus]GHB75759.1 cyclase [Streptomyces cirratus]